MACLLVTGLSSISQAQEVDLGQYAGVYKLKITKNADYCPSEIKITKKNKRQLRISERLIFRFNTKISSDIVSEYNEGYVFNHIHKVTNLDGKLQLEINDSEVCNNGAVCKIGHFANGSKEVVEVSMEQISYSNTSTFSDRDENNKFLKTQINQSHCLWTRVTDKN